MRLFACLVVALTGSTALGQTEVNAALTAGLIDNVRTGSVQGIGALRVEAVHGFENRAAIRGAAVGELVDGRYGDLGSFMTLEYRSWRIPATFGLTVVPFNPARVRESFDYANRWGAPLQEPAPVVMISAETERFRVWGALQGSPLLDNSTNTTFVALSGIIGGSVNLPAGFRAELNLGVHDRGIVPLLAQQGIREPVTALGGSGRLSWTYGGGVGSQVDLTTYAQDPARYERFFAFDSLETPSAAWVALEGGVASQRLQDAMTFATMRASTTGYVDFQARARFSALRLFGTVRVQPMSFLQFDTPGLPPFFVPPATSAPLVGVWVGADYRFASIGLEPGLQARVVQPASARAVCLSADLDCTRTLVAPARNRFTILPANQAVSPILGIKGSLRYSPFSFVMVVGEVDYERDANGVVFTDTTSAPRALNTVTLRLLLQGRF